jgi:hypothetical protein
VNGDEIDVALERSRSAGGQIVVGKTAVPGGLGHYALSIDSEGNRVGLHAV